MKMSINPEERVEKVKGQRNTTPHEVYYAIAMLLKDKYKLEPQIPAGIAKLVITLSATKPEEKDVDYSVIERVKSRFGLVVPDGAKTVQIGLDFENKETHIVIDPAPSLGIENG